MRGNRIQRVPFRPGVRILTTQAEDVAQALCELYDAKYYLERLDAKPLDKMIAELVRMECVRGFD